MGCKTVFSSSIAKEVLDSFVWYEGRVKGLGRRFIDIIDLTIELILLNLEGFPNKKGPYREATLKKIPVPNHLRVYKRDTNCLYFARFPY